MRRGRMPRRSVLRHLDETGADDKRRADEVAESARLSRQHLGKMTETQAPPIPSESNQRIGSQKTPHIALHKATAIEGRRWLARCLVQLALTKQPWWIAATACNVTFGTATDIHLPVQVRFD